MLKRRESVPPRCRHGIWYDRAGGHTCPDTVNHEAAKTDRNLRRAMLRDQLVEAQRQLEELGPDE